MFITFALAEMLGGSEVMLWRYLTNMDPSRVTAQLAFLRDGTLPERIRDELHLPVVVIPERRLRNLGYTTRVIARLRTELRRYDPDVILSFDGKSHVYTGTAAATLGLGSRAVWWQHIIPTGRHPLDIASALVPAAAVGTSSNAAAEAQRRVHPRRPTFVVHPGIPTPDSLAPVNLPIPPGRFVVGIVARLQPWKGIHILIDAVSRLVTEGIDCHLLVVGGSPYGLSPEYPAQLEAQIYRLGLDDRVTLTGQVPDPMRYMSRMDVVCNVSEREPAGISILEAMSLGRPVIGVGDAGMREVVEPGVSGLLIDHHLDDEGLADRIRMLVANPALAAKLGAGARARVEKEFKAETMANRITEHLERIAASAHQHRRWR